jgi:uracil phosphoribosyltransferase
MSNDMLIQKRLNRLRRRHGQFGQFRRTLGTLGPLIGEKLSADFDTVPANVAIGPGDDERHLSFAPAAEGTGQTSV